MCDDRIGRRQMLAACAGSLMTVSGAASPGVKFGVRSPFPKIDLAGRAAMVKSLGYDGIELGPEWLNQSADAIREQLGGIKVSAIVGSLKLLDTDAAKRAEAVALDRARLEMARELGADCVIEVPIFGPNRFQDISPVMTPREIEERLLIAGLKQLAPDVLRTGVTLLLEPLTRKETHFMNLQQQGAETIRVVGAPGFKLLSDFYHMQLEEQNIGETMARFGEYTGYVHLADGEQRTEPGSLPFDYRPGFRALKKWNFSGWLTMESKATDDPRSALARGLEYIRLQWSEA